MFDTTASPSSSLGATRRTQLLFRFFIPWFFFRFLIGEFIQLSRSNRAVDLRSMAEIPNCITFGAFFGNWPIQPTQAKILLWGSGRLADTFWTGTKENHTHSAISIRRLHM